MKKKLCLIGLISVLLSAGCGSRNKTVPDLPPAPAEERDYDFIFVCPIIDNEYWQSCIQGIWDADEELGTTTHVTLVKQLILTGKSFDIWEKRWNQSLTESWVMRVSGPCFLL